MLEPFNHYNNVYIEISKNKHGHGGNGWEYSSYLWSPIKDRGGHDRYSLMREPQIDDLILHFYKSTINDIFESRLLGCSFVNQPYQIVDDIPPYPGDWDEMAPYYRISLRDYIEFPKPLSFSVITEDYSTQILNEILEDRPKYFPFSTYGSGIRTSQGLYLAKCTNRLFNLLMDAVSINMNYNTENPENENVHKEYAEARRLSQEKYYFSRNPHLVKDAKEHYGYKCRVCGFDFQSFYGKELGQKYIEAHHKNPISERPEREWSEEIRSTIDDIDVLCPNCHRMIHRRKPALTVEELIKEINNSTVA